MAISIDYVLERKECQEKDHVKDHPALCSEALQDMRGRSNNIANPAFKGISGSAFCCPMGTCLLSHWHPQESCSLGHSISFTSGRNILLWALQAGQAKGTGAHGYTEPAPLDTRIPAPVAFNLLSLPQFLSTIKWLDFFSNVFNFQIERKWQQKMSILWDLN